ncbi:hypothetical protein BpHYR1_006868 [Brachionus plicatilis]|uniref:Uncharacterized protein n=1 Tax=Brachionus plicatilis TaxID=10195 RepID=A0A3M7PAD2_BRAPC|nr:hypothetical protein BpHYR1_006868 [Brachionus plicatilis]
MVSQLSIKAVPFDLFVDKDWNKPQFKMNNSKFTLKHLMPSEISNKVSAKTFYPTSLQTSFGI